MPKQPKSDAEKLTDAILGLTSELKRYNDAHAPTQVKVERSEPELYRADYDPASRENRETAAILGRLGKA